MLPVFITNTFNQELQRFDDYFDNSSSCVLKIAAYACAFFTTLGTLIATPFKACFPKSTNSPEPTPPSVESKNPTLPELMRVQPPTPLNSGDPYLERMRSTFPKATASNEQIPTLTDPLVLAARYAQSGKMPNRIY